jgi:hypothetical protein
MAKFKSNEDDVDVAAEGDGAVPCRARQAGSASNLDAQA